MCFLNCPAVCLSVLSWQGALWKRQLYSNNGKSCRYAGLKSWLAVNDFTQKHPAKRVGIKPVKLHEWCTAWLDTADILWETDTVWVYWKVFFYVFVYMYTNTCMCTNATDKFKSAVMSVRADPTEFSHDPRNEYSFESVGLAAFFCDCDGRHRVQGWMVYTHLNFMSSYITGLHL